MPGNPYNLRLSKRTGPRQGLHYQYAKDSPTRLQRTHRAICDFMLTNPTAHYKDIAKAMGMSALTVSTLVHNDAFQQYMEQRQLSIIDPVIRANYTLCAENLFKAAAEVLHRELLEKPSFAKAIQIAKVTGHARGMVERQIPVTQTNIQVNFAGELEAARARAASETLGTPLVQAPVQ